MTQHFAPVSGIDTRSFRLVATAGYDNCVILWDSAGKISIADARHDHLANQCRFSASGDRLVSASSDYTARVWSVPSLSPISVLSGHQDDVEMAVFSPDERRVATASRDHRVRIFDARGALQACLDGHESDVISVEWNACGDEVISSGDDGTIRRFSARTFSLLETIDLGGMEADTIVCGPRATFFAGTDTGEIVTLRGEVVSRLKGHASGIKRLIYRAATRTLLSAGYDRMVKLWDVGHAGDLVLVQAFEAPPVVWLRCAAFAGPSSIVFGTFGSSFARYDCQTKMWDLSSVDDTPGVNATCLFGGAIHTVGDAGVVCRDGKAIRQLGSLCNFLVDFDGQLLTGGHLGQLFDALTGEIVYRHHSPLNCGANFRRHGVEHLVIGSYTGECMVFRRREGCSVDLVEVLCPHDNAVKGVACNERHIFTVCATGAAAFTSIATFDRDRYLPRAHSRISNGAARLPDGRFASVSRDRLLRLWTDDRAVEIKTPNSHSIKCVTVCPTTGLIATGAYDGLVAVYDERGGTWVKVEQPTRAGISSLSHAGRPGVFLASSYDGRVYKIVASSSHPVAA
ncbi:WD-repeat protein [Burkholderia pseudomallei]|uniref:WD40 repeat domain-containing protein n=1 Tax=Burkholderia pseudomallei TaxID=28450 RepID=UPI000F05DC19|nr:WD40 repeat domain-containing protein [Burkholderia pseudomallei]VBY40150.1 WD-repeat protein [Burkholderia pseudomallei]VBY63065.1 WD-repeat protein [Burkholderia pseudomallei]VBY77263.1 WD-repeat protein [Burkholderia pseudomallei]VBY88181.1 WD-repeat protein [Burkholderia pseudomallei]